MIKKMFCLLLLLAGHSTLAETNGYFNMPYGRSLPGSTDQVGLWWASSGWKISQTKPLPKITDQSIVICAARNEAEAAQLVVRPTVPLSGFVVNASELAATQDACIPASDIDFFKVCYVPIVESTDSSRWSHGPATAGPKQTTGLWPDPLPPFKGPVDLEPNKNQPIWVRVNVPSNTPAGVYAGTIHLMAENYSADVSLNVEVYDFNLPDRMTCITAFNFWPNEVFRYHKLSDPQHKRLVIDKYLASFSAHHISPYDPAPLDGYNVTWPKITDAIKPEEIKPTFDWAAWDKAMERAIEYYHFNSFRIDIPGLGHKHAAPELLGFKGDTPHYKAAFNAYCRAVQKHLRQKGWMDEAFAYWFDEPAPEHYPAVMNGCRKLKQAAPDINRMITEQVEPQLFGGPNIWCSPTYLYDYNAAEHARYHNDRCWWYLCCSPKGPYCALFIDHAGTEPRIWLWQSWKYKIEGVLSWMTNYWNSAYKYPDPEHPQNPYEDAKSRSDKGTFWGNGEGRLIYPPEDAADGRPAEPVLDGPVDSIRWEMLRDGIEDYEYMVILKRLLELKRGKITVELHEYYSSLLNVPHGITKDMTNFTKDPAPIEAHRHQIARAIAELNRF